MAQTHRNANFVDEAAGHNSLAKTVVSLCSFFSLVIGCQGGLAVMVKAPAQMLQLKEQAAFIQVVRVSSLRLLSSSNPLVLFLSPTLATGCTLTELVDLAAEG